jgi:hypothetical protein
MSQKSEKKDTSKITIDNYNLRFSYILILNYIRKVKVTQSYRIYEWLSSFPEKLKEPYGIAMEFESFQNILNFLLKLDFITVVKKSHIRDIRLSDTGLLYLTQIAQNLDLASIQLSNESNNQKNKSTKIPKSQPTSPSIDALKNKFIPVIDQLVETVESHTQPDIGHLKASTIAELGEITQNWLDQEES